MLRLHVSTLTLGHHQVSRFASEETIQCVNCNEISLVAWPFDRYRENLLLWSNHRLYQVSVLCKWSGRGMDQWNGWVLGIGGDAVVLGLMWVRWRFPRYRWWEANNKFRSHLSVKFGHPSPNPWHFCWRRKKMTAYKKFSGSEVQVWDMKLQNVAANQNLIIKLTREKNLPLFILFVCVESTRAAVDIPLLRTIAQRALMDFQCSIWVDYQVAK